MRLGSQATVAAAISDTSVWSVCVGTRGAGLQTSRRNQNNLRDAGAHDGERRPRTNPSRLRTAAVACDNVLHGVGRSAFVLAPVLALLVLVGGLGYVRLRHGPISLKFLVDPIER